jgi:Family of unknown function (DUF6114)
LLVIAGASEMLVSEQAPLPALSQIGIRALAGYLTPVFMLLCGVLLWFTPVARTYHSLLVIVLALDSWLTANLGGFFVGLLISLIGGGLAFAWMTDTDYGKQRPPRGKAKVRLLSRAPEMPAAVRKLWAACPRRRAPGPARAPVQEALFELSTEPGPGEAVVGRSLAGPKERKCRAHAERIAATAARWSRSALTQWRRLLER